MTTHDYQYMWEKRKEVLEEKEELYGIDHNPKFNPLTMALYAEIKDLQLLIEELEEDEPQ